MGRFKDDPRADWLPFEEALDRIMACVVPLAAETCPTGDSLGRVLSADIHALLTLPPWDNSGMDGFAVRAVDVESATPETPVSLDVVGSSLPGAPWTGTVAEGQAIRIMTGGPVPGGASTIVRVEDTDGGEEGTVRVTAAPEVGRHIRPRGEDMVEGDRVLTDGTWLGAGALAVLEGMGLHTVPVRRRPRVAILTTGDELEAVTPGRRPWSDDTVPDTNSPTLARAVEAAGGVAVPLGIARDSMADLRAALARLQEAQVDVVLTTGGASMGVADLVKGVLEEAGLELDFWRTRIRPGSPFSFGRLPRDPNAPALPGQDHPIFVFGLPGNPVSSFVTYQVLAQPFILGLSGLANCFRPVIPARVAGSLAGAKDLALFLRVTLVPGEDGYEAVPTGAQGSGLLHSLGTAQGLAVLPRGVSRLESGDPVRVVLLGDRVPPMPRIPLDP